MTKITRYFQTVGQAIANGKLGNAAAINARVASTAGVKYLHGNGPSPEWDLIPAERDLFTQYEPPTRMLTARMEDVGLYRYLSQRYPLDVVLEVM